MRYDCSRTCMSTDGMISVLCLSTCLFVSSQMLTVPKFDVCKIQCSLSICIFLTSGGVLMTLTPICWVTLLGAGVWYFKLSPKNENWHKSPCLSFWHRRHFLLRSDPLVYIKRKFQIPLWWQTNWCHQSWIVKFIFHVTNKGTIFFQRSMTDEILLNFAVMINEKNSVTHWCYLACI